MKKRGVRKGIQVTVLGLALTCARLASAYTQPPTAPASSTNGSYTVSWTNQCSSDCAYMWLEEKVGSGAFTAVTGGSPLAFTGRPAGDYTYRLARLTTSYLYYFAADYSAEVVVHVAPDAQPVDPLLTQRGYQYRTRVGDIDYDGRRDLLVERVSGGAANNGVLDKVIVQQTATPGQYTLVSPTAAQAAVAAYWPVAPAQVAVEDINADGFVDVTVKGVASALGVPDARNLIVFSPGRASGSVAKGLRLVDDELLQFAGNMLDYEVDQDYFVNNAMWTYFYVASLYSVCSDGMYVTGDPIYGGSMSGCVWVYQYTSGYYPDYSWFSSAAVSIFQAAENAHAGRISMTAAIDAIDGAAEGVLRTTIGGWNMEEVLGSTGEHTHPDARRAMEVFWAILGIGRAAAEEVPTVKAPKQVPRAPGKIYVTKRALATPLALHVALEYTSPVSVFRSISAYDSDDRPTIDGRLISEKNWYRDAPALMMTVSEVQRPAGFASNDEYWLRLLAADSAYVDGSLAYDLVPSVGKGGYNCASYTHGILNATGGVAVRIPASGNWTNMWGWGVPVPPSSFY